MEPSDCIFCKIVIKEAQSEIVAEDDSFVAFNDIRPKAPVHLLVVPKIHIASVSELKREHRELMGDMILFAQKVAEKLGVAQSGYKLIFNVGRGGGQVIDHIHLHILGGWGTNVPASQFTA